MAKNPHHSLLATRPGLLHHDSVASNTSSSSFGSLFTHRNANGNGTSSIDHSSSPKPLQTGDDDQVRKMSASDAPWSSPSRDGPSSIQGHRRSSSTPISPIPISPNRPLSGISVDDADDFSIGTSPRRVSKTNSLKRKPVPSYIMHNQGSLPPSHPFATTTPPHSRSHSPASGSVGGFKIDANSLRPSSLLSVGTDRTSPISSRSASPSKGIERGMGRTPPPPLRKPAGGPVVPPRSASRGVPVEKNAPSPVDVDGDGPVDVNANERDGQQRLTFNGTLQEFMDNSTRLKDQIPLDDLGEGQGSRPQSRVVSLDRPLPPLPTESDEPSGRPSSRPGTPLRRRSVSADSSGVPVTPQAPARDPAASPQLVLSDFSDGVPEASISVDKRSAAHLRPPKTSFFRRDSDKAKKTAAAAAQARERRDAFRRPSVFAGYEAEEESEFSVDRVPSKQRMWEASTCLLRDENGDLVSFGDFYPRYGGSKASPPLTGVSKPIPPGLMGNVKGKGKSKEVTPVQSPAPRSPTPVPTTPPLDEKYPSDPSRRPPGLGGPTPKTVIFFIRHFWCGQCQDYTFASLSLLDPEALEKAGIRVIIISNGSWKIIKAYKKLFNCPFPIYVDGPRRLYQLMGMTKMTNDFGPMFKGRASYHQRPVPTQLLHGLSNAFFRMPLANPGTLTQLGGEFILSPGWKCDFAHRMTNTSDHMEAPDVLRQAGCEFPTKSEVADIELAESQKEELERLEKEMQAWRDGRHQEIERIRQKKAARRGETYVPERRASGLDPELLASVTNAVEGDGELIDNAELDKRFERVMQLEEHREKVKMATERLMFSREKGDLEVEVERSEIERVA